MTREVEGYIRQLANYIKKNVSKGYTSESLRWALVNQGYSRLEVSRAIELANKELALEAPKFIEKPIIKVDTSVEMPKIAKLTFWQKVREIFS